MIISKIKSLLLLMIVSHLALGNVSASVIKVYVSDFESGKIIRNAVVNLEGYELPPIKAKYDKSKKCYYFDSVPSGYNTIMAFHQHYNEKGFQNNYKLPDDIYLRLSYKENVRYSFYPGTNDEKQNIYVEDPYKIALNVFSSDCTRAIKLIDSLSLEHSLDIETVNPYNAYNEYRYDCPSYHKSMQYPTPEGIGSYELNDSPELISIFIRRKDGNKFKRYNDPIIKKLRDCNVMVMSIIYIKFFVSENAIYKKRLSYKSDKINNIPDILKSKVILCKTINDTPHYKYLPIMYDANMAWETNLGTKILDSKILSNNSLGLGVIDQLEYFSFKNTINICSATNPFSFCN
jgi:hypothetical protein